MVEKVSFILDTRWSTFLLISWFARLSNLYLIICHTRHPLRKYLCKSRGLAVHLSTTIPLTLGTVPLLILISSIPQFGTHLMVRKSCAWPIPLQQTWIKISSCHCRYQRWESRADSTRCYWCITSCSPSSDRGYYRAGTASFHHPFLRQTDSNLLIKISPIYRHSILQHRVVLLILRSILMKVKSDRQPPLLLNPCQRRPEIG